MNAHSWYSQIGAPISSPRYSAMRRLSRNGSMGEFAMNPQPWPGAGGRTWQYGWMRKSSARWAKNRPTISPPSTPSEPLNSRLRSSRRCSMSVMEPSAARWNWDGPFRRTSRLTAGPAARYLSWTRSTGSTTGGGDGRSSPAAVSGWRPDCASALVAGSSSARPLVSALRMRIDRPRARAASGRRFAPNSSTRTTTSTAMCHGRSVPTPIGSTSSCRLLSSPSYVCRPAPPGPPPRGGCAAAAGPAAAPRPGRAPPARTRRARSNRSRGLTLVRAGVDRVGGLVGGERRARLGAHRRGQFGRADDTDLGSEAEHQPARPAQVGRAQRHHPVLAPLGAHLLARVVLGDPPRAPAHPQGDQRQVGRGLEDAVAQVVRLGLRWPRGGLVALGPGVDA